MVFILLDWAFAIALLAGFIFSFKVGYKKFYGNRWVLVFSLIYFVKISVGLIYQMDFISGYYHHCIGNHMAARKYLNEYLNGGPSNNVLRILLHYDAAYNKASSIMSDQSQT